MLGIFLPGQKRFFFRRFSPFLSHVAPAMLLQKRENGRKMPSFLPPAENPQHAKKSNFNTEIAVKSVGMTHQPRRHYTSEYLPD